MVIPRTYGRCGNFLFQAAATIGYALDHQIEFTLPDRTADRKSNPIYLQHLINPRFNPRLDTIKLEEQSHGYCAIPWDEKWRSINVMLDGYWQSEKYFKAHRNEILELFDFTWRSWKGFVSFHVRRGDYLTLTRKHPPVTLEWMDRAMRQFPGYQFVFFSDDIDWCKQTFGKRKDCSFSNNKSEVDDLAQMSWCEHHICSASTFSWWGAYLDRNPEKRIIFPNWWFTPGYQGLETSDIVPTEWERQS